MIRCMCFSVIAVATISSAVWANPNLRSASECNSVQPDLLLRFADTLYDELDHYRAIGEYRRILSYCPSHSDAYNIARKVFFAYYHSEHYLEALEWSHSLERMYNTDPVFASLSWLLSGDALLRLDNLPAARKYYARIVETESNQLGSKQRLQAAYYGIATSYALDGQFDLAITHYENIREDSNLYERAQTAIESIGEVSQINPKSPSLAACLNIIPGLGYTYAGLHETAIAAFIVNVLAGAATVSAWRNDLPGVGVGAGLLTIGWYTGGIYGSRVGAMRYNQSVLDRLRSVVLP